MMTAMIFKFGSLQEVYYSCSEIDKFVITNIVIFQLFCGSQEHRETNIYSAERKGWMLLTIKFFTFL